MILLMNVDKDNPSQAEGESVQIQGAGLTGFELKGNTHQDTLTGINLLTFPYYETTKTINGITFTVKDDGTIHVQGTASAKTEFLIRNRDINLNITEGETYTLATSGLGTTDSTLWLDTYGQSGNFLDKWSLSSSNPYASAVAQSKDIKPLLRISVANGATINTDVKVWLYKGTYSSSITYEPYCGGIPSPNPDYPQPVKVVTGDNTINVHGKNLFDKDNILIGYVKEDGTLSTDNAYRTSDFIFIKPNTIYYKTLTQSPRTKYFDKNKQPLNTTTYQDISIGGGAGTFTTPNNAYYLRFSFPFVGSSAIDVNTIMIKEGSATDYEPYQGKDYEISLGSIELCKIGTYQDYIYKENNKWYKHSEIGKIVLDGSENWGNIQQSSGYYREQIVISDIINVGSNRKTDIFCNNFYVSTTNDYNIVFHYGTQFYFYLPNGMTTKEAFLDLLENNNSIVYYPLATPTNDEITDTELKEDLEAISNIALFEGVNNISMESSNLTSSFKVYYDTWYEFDKILRNGYNIREDRDRITQKFANGHRKQFVSDYVDCSITLNLDTIDKDTTQDYLQRLKSGAYKYYSIDGKEYRTAQFIIENKPELSVESSISNNVDVNEYQITLLKAGD